MSSWTGSATPESELWPGYFKQLLGAVARTFWEIGWSCGQNIVNNRSELRYTHNKCKYFCVGGQRGDTLISDRLI